jgi:hypothetical protein
VPTLVAALDIARVTTAPTAMRLARFMWCSGGESWDRGPAGPCCGPLCAPAGELQSFAFARLSKSPSPVRPRGEQTLTEETR